MRDKWDGHQRSRPRCPSLLDHNSLSACLQTAHFDRTSFLEARRSQWHTWQYHVFYGLGKCDASSQDAQSGTTELFPSHFLRFFARFSRARCLNCKEHSASVCCFMLFDLFVSRCLTQIYSWCHNMSQHSGGKLVVHQCGKCKSSFNSSTSIDLNSIYFEVEIRWTWLYFTLTKIYAKRLIHPEQQIQQSSSIFHPKLKHICPPAFFLSASAGCKIFFPPEWFPVIPLGREFAGRCRLRTCVVQCSFLLPGAVAAGSELFNSREFGR